MKVLMLSTNLTETGNTVMDLSKALVKKGIEVKIVAPHEPGLKVFEIFRGVRIHRFKYFFPVFLERIAGEPGVLPNLKNSWLAKLEFPFFAFSFLIESLKQSRKVNVIHAHWAPTALIGIIAGKLFGKKVILTLHGDDMRKFPDFFKSFIIKNVDFTISSHDDLIKEAKRLAPIKKISIIRNMLNFDALDKKNNLNFLKKEMNLKKEKVVTLVGRMVEMKDPETFAKAIPLVLRKKKNVKFVFVGQGPLESKVKQIVKENNIEHKVFVAGRRKNVQEFLDLSDVFIAVSPVQNVFSVTILEAMYKGVPCILTKAGDTERFFSQNKDCLLIDIKNEKQLASSILKLLDSKTLSLKLSKNAKILLKSLGYDRETILRQTIGLYEKVAK